MITFFCSSLDFWAENLDMGGRFWLENWTYAYVTTFFCSSLDFGAENWVSADVITFKEPVLLLCSENMVLVTLLLDRLRATVPSTILASANLPKKESH